MKLQQIADSPLMKVVQYLITGVIMPLCLFLLNGLVNKVEKIEQAQIAALGERATVELRLQRIENQITASETSIAVMREKVQRHDYQLERAKNVPFGTN